MDEIIRALFAEAPFTRIHATLLISTWIMTILIYIKQK